MSGGISERYWDERARENALFYVDNELDYENPDVESFWRRGDEVVQRMLDSVALEPAPDAVVVDLGCGVGRLSRALAQRVKRVIAVDVSQEMLQLGRRYNPDIANIEWVHGDGMGLGMLSDADVDGVFSHVVFQHLPNAEMTLGYVREMGRVLKPDGWALFQVSSDPAIHRRRTSLRDVAARLLGRGTSDDRAWWGSAVDLQQLRATAEAAELTIERLLDPGSQYTTVLARRQPCSP